jgi:Flp pilus assembly protein TadD
MSRLPALLDLHRADPADADLLFMIASELASAGRHAEAVDWLSRYVEQGRDVGAGHALAADCLLELGRTDEARAQLERGVEAAMRGGHPTLAGELRDRIDELA